MLAFESLIRTRSVCKKWREEIQERTPLKKARRGMLQLYDHILDTEWFYTTRDLNKISSPLDRKQYISDVKTMSEHIPEDFRIWIEEWPERAVFSCIWPHLKHERFEYEDIHRFGSCEFQYDELMLEEYEFCLCFLPEEIEREKSMVRSSRANYAERKIINKKSLQIWENGCGSAWSLILDHPVIDGKDYHGYVYMNVESFEYIWAHDWIEFLKIFATYIDRAEERRNFPEKDWRLEYKCYTPFRWEINF
jgi:hypothetical protein